MFANNLHAFNPWGLFHPAASAFASFKVIAKLYLLQFGLQRERGGEDAVFTVCKGAMGALGVADGVGGWAEDGIDAAAYSRAFVRACQEAIESTEGTEGGWSSC